ncbi:hypothetical protein MTP99_001469 [Tenebrio molitor]|jgi:hypothetical protein|nr:hypothetical protein MTP99_001469 [Tenebrio molitor]
MKVLSPVVYNLRSPSGQKILRAHIKDLKPYRVAEPPTDCANIYRMPNPRAHRRQRTCRVPSSSCVDDRPARLSWPKPLDGPPNSCSSGPEGRRRPPRRGRGDADPQGCPERTRSPTDEPDTSGPNCQRGNPLAPAGPTSRLNLPDRRLGQAGPPSADRGITGA